VASFIVETFAPQASEADLERAAESVRGAASMAAPAVTYVRSYLVPGDEMCFHVLEAASAGAVSEVVALAGVEPERIVEALP
jgi:hypothetical protein